MDINKNKPWTLNQIPQQRPAIPTSSETLTGFIANSFNAGHNRVIHWKQVMAGEKHKECRLSMKVKLLTPLTPPYQNLYLTTRAYFVPNIRVWKNAEKYTSQKGGSAEVKVTEIPNLGGKYIPTVSDDEANNKTNYCNTTFWRDSFIACYLPRLGTMSTFQNTQEQEQENSIILPKINVLPLRGRLAIYNDWERNKEFDSEVQEWNADTVSDAEWRAYQAEATSTPIKDQDYYTMRARRPNSYYSAFRTELQGFETTYPPTDMSADKALITWASWESKIAEARSEPENTNANDWQIIARIRGSKIAEQGKVQLIGENTTTLNYAAVTQNAYNNAEDINVNFKVLGQQGAYSYTEINIPVYAGFEAIEEGFIHIIATVWADSVFTSGIDRTLLNVNPLDQYRPDLKDDKNDVLYEIETSTSNIAKMTNKYQATGFKRKYNEYFKLPNVIAGDLTNDGYFKFDLEGNYYVRNTVYEPQNTYQFFEDDRYYMVVPGGIVKKKPWKDYSDLLVNKNQAIMQDVISEESTLADPDSNNAIYVDGQNQIDVVGKVYLDCILPIDGSIKDNFTDWGEH